MQVLGEKEGPACDKQRNTAADHHKRHTASIIFLYVIIQAPRLQLFLFHIVRKH